MVLSNILFNFYWTIFLLKQTVFVLFFALVSSVILSPVTALKTFMRNLTSFFKVLIFFLLAFFLFLSIIKVVLLIIMSKNLSYIDLNIMPSFLSFFSIETTNMFLSDAILVLAYTSGLICLKLLGERNLSKYLPNSSIFAIFILLTILMVYTSNILIMFIAFEFIFVPTIYFAYSLGYMKKTDKSIFFLFIWTLSGAFLVLCGLSYVYIQYKTLVYKDLLLIKFTESEVWWLELIIFIGFSVKVPVFPLHFWLTKIHVEAPAGFSIFLSGFLVKAAIYCLFILVNIFSNTSLLNFIIFVSLLGIIESSCKMWTQTDIKKTIAFATIQEMNIILLLLVTFGNSLNYVIIVFILMHGWLSTLMFFLIDVIQKKLGTRSIVNIGGIASHIPKLKIYIWIVLLFMSGFPLTVKFVVEALLVNSLITNSYILTSITLIAAIVVGVLGFFRQFLLILYGENKLIKDINSTLSKRDQYIFNTVCFLLISLNFLTLFLY